MKLEALLPEVYYKESRDFAYVARVLEICMNYIKTGADCVNMNLDNNSVSSMLVELLADTLGFNSKHKYVTKDLIVISSAFSELLHNKGNLKAVDLAIRLLLNSQNIKNKSDFDFCTFNPITYELEINIPDTLSDLILLEDLFDYILPVGVTYVFTKFGNMNNQTTTNVDIESDIINIENIQQSDTQLGIIESNNLDLADAPGSIYSGLVVSDSDSND